MMNDSCPLFVIVFNILRESAYLPSSSSSSLRCRRRRCCRYVTTVVAVVIAFALAIANALQGLNKRRFLVLGAFEKIFLLSTATTTTTTATTTKATKARHTNPSISNLSN